MREYIYIYIRQYFLGERNMREYIYIYIRQYFLGERNMREYIYILDNTSLESET